MNNDSKLRPLYLAKILFEQTDEEHDLTTARLMQILEERYGIVSHRQTIKSDMELLRQFGLEIQEIRSTQNRYNLVSRQFDTAELKLLIDAVSSAKFISAEKSAALASKLSDLASTHQAGELKRNISVEGRIRTNNGKIYTIVDAINRGINAGRKISFLYSRRNARKERVSRQNGEPYIVSPLQLIWNGDYYYLAAIKEGRDFIQNFRIDRISTNPEILEAPADQPPKGFDMNAYINTTFRMFSATPTEVELLCADSVMDAIIDRFGEEVKILPNEDKSFRAVVTVSTSHIFYTWVAGFFGLVKIISPEQVKAEYRDMIRRAAESAE